jgi:hypothetical protein
MKQLILAISLLLSLPIFSQRVADLPKPTLKVNEKVINPGIYLQRTAEYNNAAIVCAILAFGTSFLPNGNKDLPSTGKITSTLFGVTALCFHIGANYNLKKASIALTDQNK